MSGPPPKPTALKLLAGNPGHRKLNDKEPKPAIGAAPPAWIKADPVLLAKWKFHAPRLTRLGLLTEIDDTALGMVCVLEVRLEDLLVIEGIATTDAILDLSKELRQLWSRFGMTPADRSRVKVEKPPPESKLSRYMSGAKA